MVFWVYILYSQEFDKYYIGQTNDMSDRLSRHNSGSVGATKPYRPWIVKLTIQKETRGKAMILEKKLKNLNRQRLLQFISKYS